MEQRQSMYKLALMRSRSLDAKRVVKAEHGRARAEPREQAGRQGPNPSDVKLRWAARQMAERRSPN